MRLNKITVILITILLLIFVSVAESFAQGKNKFNKRSRNWYKTHYSSSIMNPKRKCELIGKKRTQKPKKNIFAKKYKVKKYKPVKSAESSYVASVTPKPAPTPAPKPKPAPQPQPVEEKTIEEKHTIEDDILRKNKLPTPTSEKHAEIRDKVDQQLKTIDDDAPVKLEPLYFTFDQDEFAFVDMEPFLIAAEYALQGRMLLIEGHTDSSGKDNYNFKLSMERVERIKNLMIDMGVSEDKISIVGYGEEKSSGGKNQDDRRVDFTVF